MFSLPEIVAMNKKAGQDSKKAQLKRIFKTEVTKLVQGHENVLEDNVLIPASAFVEKLVNKLMYEVEIRTYLRG